MSYLLADMEIPIYFRWSRILYTSGKQATYIHNYVLSIYTVFVKCMHLYIVYFILFHDHVLSWTDLHRAMQSLRFLQLIIYIYIYIWVCPICREDNMIGILLTQLIMKWSKLLSYINNIGIVISVKYIKFLNYYTADYRSTRCLSNAFYDRNANKPTSALPIKLCLYGKNQPVSSHYNPNSKQFAEKATLQ